MVDRANRESREEEYLRRMRERGYTPTLNGMDDEDIKWELAKMDGRNPWEEARDSRADGGSERGEGPSYTPNLREFGNLGNSTQRSAAVSGDMTRALSWVRK